MSKRRSPATHSYTPYREKYRLFYGRPTREAQEQEREPDVQMSRRFARRLLALLSSYRIDVDVRREARGEGPLPEGRNLTSAIRRLKKMLDTEDQ